MIYHCLSSRLRGYWGCAPLFYIDSQPLAATMGLEAWWYEGIDRIINTKILPLTWSLLGHLSSFMITCVLLGHANYMSTQSWAWRIITSSLGVWEAFGVNFEVHHIYFLLDLSIKIEICQLLRKHYFGGEFIKMKAANLISF